MRRAAEALFSAFERVVTAALYPVCRIRERLAGRIKVPILMYHQIAPAGRGMPSCRDRVSPERFEMQVRALLEAGYRVISLSDLARWIEAGARPDPGRCAVLTFDDGYRGQFAFAFPILHRLGLPATFFVTTGYVGRPAPFPHLAAEAGAAGGGEAPPPAWLPLSWDEVREMAGRGIAIESHSVTHRSMACLDPEEAEFEVGGSKEALERRLEKEVRLFAYPFGSQAYGDFDPEARYLLHRAGYRAACTTVVGRVGTGADRFALPRIPMEDSDGPFRVRCKLAGAYDWVGTVKAVWQRLLPREERVDAPLPADLVTGNG